MDFKEKFNEILEDLDGRFKNPLILSFIIVWTCQHWELIFMVLNFDANLLLDEKTILIKDYLKSHGFTGMVLTPLGYSFISLMAFYVIGVIAQAVKVWLGKRFSAAMLAISDNGNYELKSISEQHKKRSRKFQNEAKTFEEQIISMKLAASEDEEKILSLNKKITDLEENIKGYLNITYNANEQIKKLNDEINSHKIDIASRDTKIADYMRRLNEAELYKLDFPEPKTNPSELFGNHLWNVYNYNASGEMELTDTIMFDGKYFVNKLNEKNLVTEFEFYSNLGTVIFKKGKATNKLFITGGEFLKGVEDGNLIAYQLVPDNVSPN